MLISSRDASDDEGRIVLDRILKGRYRIVRRLGKGGMSQVFLALDIESQADVAVKQLMRSPLPPELRVGPDAIQRFQREANILQQLRHNNIIEFYEYFTEENDHFIAMEYVSGGSLHDKLRKRLKKQEAFSSEEVCQLGLAMVGAFTIAHDLGIVHRDIKPSNILFAADETVRVTDFGVARLKPGSPIDRVQSTAFGIIPGTVKYMSPESLHYGAEPDERSDIWSLGVVLYEMLTGRAPFESSNGDNRETANLITNAEPPPITDVVAAAWPTLVRVVNRCLVKQREQRYRSMWRVGADLDRALRGEDMSAAEAEADPIVLNSAALRAALQRMVRNVETTDNNPTPAPQYNADYHQLTALIVGAGQYRDGEVAPEPALSEGAQRFAALLREQYFFDVQLLVDEQATRRNVYAALARLQQADDDDCLVLYWAGAARSRRDRFGGESSFLALHDSVWNNWNTFVDLEALVNVRFLPAKHIFFILDMPTSGPAHLVRTGGSSPSTEYAMQHVGLHLLVSNAPPAPNRGGITHFTQALLDGLGGGAVNAKGLISADTLGAFVVGQVQTASKAAQKPIYARLPGGDEGDLMFRMPPDAYLPAEILLCVRSEHASVRHGSVQMLRDFALQPRSRVQQVAVDQLRFLSENDPIQSVKAAAREVLRELHDQPPGDDETSSW